MATRRDGSPRRGERDGSLELVLQDVEVGPAEDGYRPVRLRTSRGPIACRHYPAPAAKSAAVWVGGAGGGWDTPARGLYPRLCRELAGQSVASLRVRYRHPADLDESTLDVLAGLAYLEGEGVRAAVLAGHSFGGAVVLRAAAANPVVCGVVPLATQTYGTDAVEELTDCPVLLLHGEADRVLPAACSRAVYRQARGPARLVLYPGAGHGLDEVAEQVHDLLARWVPEQLRRRQTA